MNDMLNSLEGFDSGSNYKFGQKMEKANNPRSLFDLSHLNTMTIDNAGLLIPIALWETLPTDDFDISVDALLRVMPQVVPLYSRQRLFIYGFYSRYSDLWNHWQVFMDKGYTGNVSKRIPILHTDYGTANVTGGSGLAAAKVLPNSLHDYIGLPLGAAFNRLFLDADSEYNARISALPYMMYLRIYRDYFMNKNEWINDRVMLPDDDSRFRLNDDGQLLSAIDESKNFYFASAETSVKYDISLDGPNAYIMGLLYHDYPDDYFTSALPFTQRGTASTLKANGTIGSLSLNVTQTNPDFLKIAENGLPAPDGSTLPLQMFFANASDGGSLTLRRDDGQGSYITSMTTDERKRFAFSGVASGSNIPISLDTGITIENLREQIVNQIELERLARTDGSYRQFGLSFFGESSKASYDFRPTYIGGTYKNLAFTEVLQTAPGAEGQTPLASYAGHGITGISNGRIGHIHCDDYGMIMLIACIMPDVYYSQGLDRILTDSLQSDKWLPERVKLGMQPIYNKELFYAGNNGSDSGEDNYLWAYQNPFDYLRYIPNKIHGKIADSSNLSFFPYTQSRKFNSLPNWGREFSEAKNIRKDYLAAYNESAYTAQFGINIRAVRPLPYKAIPAELLN